MGKKYKDKTCVYCHSRPSVTGDHVFARQFFPVSKRGNLPQVPTCGICNSEKAVLEHYLTTMLPFGGQHRDAVRDFATMVPDRLQKNKKLLRILAENKKRVWFRTDAGIVLPTVSVPFDGEKLSSWGAFIAKGLMWHHWQLLLPDDYSISSMCLSAAGEQAFNTLFGSKIQNRVNGSLGNGVFVYRGAQGDDAALTIWEILPFGGVMLTDND